MTMHFGGWLHGEPWPTPRRLVGPTSLFCFGWMWFVKKQMRKELAELQNLCEITGDLFQGLLHFLTDWNLTEHTLDYFAQMVRSVGTSVDLKVWSSSILGWKFPQKTWQEKGPSSSKHLENNTLLASFFGFRWGRPRIRFQEVWHQRRWEDQWRWAEARDDGVGSIVESWGIGADLCGSWS